MQALFAITLFLSAFLLFLVQPLVGRMLLPLLGGAPAVWNTCMVFFQAALLAGYAYAHWVTMRFNTRGQLILHAVVLALPAIALPIAISDDLGRSAAGAEYPVLLLLKALVVGVGLPFFVVSTTGPLLQRWFACTHHPSARDPYFLYAASNFGSMLALLVYPVLVEPLLNLSQQSIVWSVGYGLFAVFIGVCGLFAWRNISRAAPIPSLPRNFAKSVPHSEISWRRRARWVFLAFVPSSMLLGTTSYITTDLAPIPLLWVIPLAIYLLSFILVFAKKPPLPHALLNRLLPIAIVMLTLVLLTGATEMRGLPVGLLLAMHLLAFFLAAMVAHGELARDRPPAEHLTEFYLWLSAGGVLGGVFNALVAPIMFHKTGLTEYPLALVLSAFVMRPRTTPIAAAKDSSRTKAKETTQSRRKQDAPRIEETGDSAVPEELSPCKQLVLDIVEPLGIGAITIGLIMLAIVLKLDPGPIRTAVMFALPCVLIYTLVDRPARFGLAVAAALLAGTIDPDQKLHYLERNFFGVLKATEIRTEENAHFRVLTHGNTIHGEQRLDHVDADGRHEPLTYYHPTGPAGHLFRDWLALRPAGQRVGAVGLGTGSLAYYGRPDDDWTFYEIDPAVKRVAEDSKLFSFLAESRTRKLNIVLGDARLQLRDVPDHHFDLLVLDAFSSDAIPMHLITREALQLYLDKLADGGVIAFHVSNRYLYLQPILAKLAENTQPKLALRHWSDTNGDINKGKFQSQWVILARSDAEFGPLTKDARWQKLSPDAKTPVWTDKFSNLLSAFQW